MSPDGKLHLAVGQRRLDQPNGSCFSPDEGKLHVNDTFRVLVRVYDVAQLGSGRFAPIYRMARFDWTTSARKS